MSWYQETKEKREKYQTAVALEKKKVALTDEQKADKAAWVETEKNSKPDPVNSVSERAKNAIRVRHHIRLFHSSKCR